MPAGKGRYTVGKKGTHGCKGFPVVGGEGKVHGCHATLEEAQAQQAAIYASQNSDNKADAASVTTSETPENPSSHLNPEVGIKHPQVCTPTSKACDDKMCKTCMKKSDSQPDESLDKACWDGYTQRGMKPKDGKMVPNCVPVAKANDLFEDSDDVEYDTDSMSKADGYSPPAGARSAARRAIKFKEDGKANGAGTAVGWTRAGQLARGETISLSTVKRMYSYFSRHEVDKQGKDWGNSANPSNGYIMWLAWGGDAGFSWSRSIVNKETDKSLFSDFGKDYTRSVTQTYQSEG